MSQFGGKDSKRHFTVVMGGKEHGLYVSSTPSSAAKKAVTKLCAANKSKKVEFHIREITQGSKKKTYGPYKGHLEKLKEPIKLKSYVIERKPVAKLSGKSGAKKGGMGWKHDWINDLGDEYTKEEKDYMNEFSDVLTIGSSKSIDNPKYISLDKKHLIKRTAIQYNPPNINYLNKFPSKFKNLILKVTVKYYLRTLSDRYTYLDSENIFQPIAIRNKEDLLKLFRELTRPRPIPKNRQGSESGEKPKELNLLIKSLGIEDADLYKEDENTIIKVISDKIDEYDKKKEAFMPLEGQKLPAGHGTADASPLRGQ